VLTANNVGNNPMGFVDPSGLEQLTADQINLITKVLGTEYQDTDIDLSQLEFFERGPTVDEVRDAAESVDVALPMSNDVIEDAIARRGMSLPDGTIFMPEGARRSSTGEQALFIHEVFHQFQYQGGDATTVFAKLLGEALQYENSKINPDVMSPYSFLPDVETLFDIPTLEGQASFIEEFSFAYLSGQNTTSFSTILQNTSLSSDAIDAE